MRANEKELAEELNAKEDFAMQLKEAIADVIINPTRLLSEQISRGEKILKLVDELAEWNI